MPLQTLLRLIIFATRLPSNWHAGKQGVDVAFYALSPALATMFFSAKSITQSFPEPQLSLTEFETKESLRPLNCVKKNLPDTLDEMVQDINTAVMQEDKGGYRQINKSLNICAFEDYLQGQTTNLPKLPNVEQLTPRVLRILGQNPGKFTYQGTNTYVIGTGTHRLIVDTSGGEPAWAELISSTLESMGVSLSHVLLTHWHGDHTGGVPDLLRLYPHLEGSIYKNEPDKGQQNITDGQVFRVEGATIRAVHAPGHSEDHMCFVLEEEQAMFTGDNILGHGTSAVEDLGIFMASLQKMYMQNCPVGFSAHGVTITDLPAKLKKELDGKLRRERQVMQALGRARTRGEKSITIQGLVTEIYGEALEETTRTLALEPFIDEVLRKLAGDCRVAFEIRGGKKKWYSVEAMPQNAGGLMPGPMTASRADARVQVM